MKSFNKSSKLIGVAVFFLIGTAGPLIASAAGPLPVDLLSTSNFVILSKTGVTNTGSHTSVITGNVGSSPITAAAMNNVFCSEITGTIYGVDAAYTGSGATTCFAGNPGVPAVVPPDANKTLVDNAVADMLTAYNDAAGRTIPTATELGSGNIGGMTLAPGLYKWSTDVSISTNLTLSGGANDTWIFQIAGNLTIASGGSVPAGVKVVLTGGAKASNVFWQVGGSTGATLGTYSTFNGTILSAKQVIIQTGAVLNGRAMAQTQVTLDANTVSIPTILHVIKLVVNGNGGTAVPSDFTLSVKKAGINVSGSPTVGTASPGTPYSLNAGTYVVSETPNPLYTQSFSGACDSSGTVTLSVGDDKVCTVINTDIPSPTPVPPSGGSGFVVLPLIKITKVPSPLALPLGSGSVTYSYEVTNIGTVAMGGVWVKDNQCSQVTYISGDTNNDSMLDLHETWLYRCTQIVSQTTTNTATAHGSARGWDAYATANATVVVGASLPAPLINIVEVPSRLTPFPFGGGNVTYTYTVTNPGVVPMHNVVVTDDKCAPVSGPSGDTNVNGLLDHGESWVYSCRTNVPVSTRNVATAEGRANGLIALGYAFSTVLVSAPSLPNTGISPDGGSTPWTIVATVGIAALVLLLIYVIQRKKNV